MKFLMDCDGWTAVNTAFVKKIYIDIYQYREKKDYKRKVNVKAHYDVGDITLITFDSGDYDKDSTAAKKYLVELVDKLNSGGNL